MNVDVTRPVVFLDIDGVLNGGWQHEYYGIINGEDILNRDGRGDWVCRSKTRALFGIFRIHKAQVIIVSSWCRDFKRADDPEIQKLQEFFEYPDILGSLHTSGSVERALEVLFFLESYPEINNYVAIDDSYHLYHEAGFPEERLIACNGRYGIADCQLAEVDDLLRTNKRRKSPYKNTLEWNPTKSTT